MRRTRLHKAAWLLLQRLNQPYAELTMCVDRRCSRFHFTLRSNLGDIVRESTLDSLSTAGLLARQRTATPTYVINDKGRQMLLERITDDELVQETNIEDTLQGGKW